jgi:ATP-dependent exoDNAse (exonuclease V) alpha subunit
MAEITGKRNKRFAHDKESIARDCIAKVELKLKVGTRVIAVVNDKKERFVNGSVGFVTELSDAKGKQFVKVLFEGDKESTKIIKHV